MFCLYQVAISLIRYLLYRILFLIFILNQNKTTAANGSLLVLFVLIKTLFRDYASKVTRIVFDDTISNIFWYYN